MLNYIAAIILHLMTYPNPTPKRTLYKSEKARLEIAAHLIEAGTRYGHPPDLLTVWFFGESSLKPHAIGARKEIGISQIHPSNFSKCARASYDLKTDRGQIMCGAMLAAKGRDACGDPRAGWAWYASPAGCKGTPKAWRIVNRRFKQLKRIRIRIRRQIPND